MRTLLAGLAIALLAAASPAAESFDDLARGARVAMHTGDAESAVKLFDSAADLAPGRAAEIAFDHGWAWVEVAWLKAQTGDFLAADAACVAAAERCGELAPLVLDLRLFSRYLYFRTEFQASLNLRGVDWGNAVKFAAETLDLSPDSVEAHYALALACDRSRKYDDARRHFSAAAGVELDPRRPYQALAEAALAAARRQRIFAKRPLHPLQARSDSGGWQTASRGRFVVRHRNKALAERVFEVLQHYMKQPVAGGLLPPGQGLGVRCEVRLYRDQGEYLAATRQPKWSDGSCQWVKRNNRLEAVVIHVFQDSPNLFESVIPHELAHARSALKPWYDGYLPAWIAEGIAESAEPLSCDLTRLRVLREGLAKNILLDASKVMSPREVIRDKDTDVFYVESWAMVNVLVARSGPARFEEFIKAARSQDPARCLQRFYGLTFIGLENLVIDFMRQNAPRRPLAPPQDSDGSAASSASPPGQSSTSSSPTSSSGSVPAVTSLTYPFRT